MIAEYEPTSGSKKKHFAEAQKPATSPARRRGAVMLLLTMPLSARIEVELYATDHAGRTLLAVVDELGNALAFVEGAEC